MILTVSLSAYVKMEVGELPEPVSAVATIEIPHWANCPWSEGDSQGFKGGAMAARVEQKFL